MNTLMERWNNFSPSEKQTLAIGGIVVALFLLYEIIWSPLANKVASLRGQVQHNQELLAWMKSADTHMDALGKSSVSKAQSVNGSLLSIMQTQIKNSPLAQHATQLRQAENNTVQVNLQKVGFDVMTIWLTELWKKYDLVVTQATITPTGTAGEVNADLVVKTSG